MSDEQTVKNLYIELCEASIQKEKEKLEEILSDDYVLVHMTGMQQRKEEYIASVLEGELKYYESIHESIEVKLEGTRAYVIGKTKTLASPFGMTKSWWKLRQDLIMEKREDKWMIIYSKASTY